MAEAFNINDFVDSNLQLLADAEEETEYVLTDEVSKDEAEDINVAVSTFNQQEIDENEESSDAFEEEQVTHRHCSLNAAKVDNLALKKHTESTKQQTKWAVNVFRGKCNNFQSNFLCKSWK